MGKDNCENPLSEDGLLIRPAGGMEEGKGQRRQKCMGLLWGRAPHGAAVHGPTATVLFCVTGP